MDGIKRTIYSNYDLWEDHSECVKDYFKDDGIDPTIDEIWDEIYERDDCIWEEEKAELKHFFNGKQWILQGVCERWNGSRKGGFVFDDFNEMLLKAAKDCDYFHFYDVNGHFYLTCSHHDGTNLYEIKRLTDKGIAYLNNWADSYTDKRSMEYVHNKLMERYSTLPHYLHRVYGCPKVENEKERA